MQEKLKKSYSRLLASKSFVALQRHTVLMQRYKIVKDKHDILLKDTALNKWL